MQFTDTNPCWHCGKHVPVQFHACSHCGKAFPRRFVDLPDEPDEPSEAARVIKEEGNSLYRGRYERGMGLHATLGRHTQEQDEEPL